MELSTKEYRTLSRMESRLILTLAQMGRRLFTIDEAKSIIGTGAKKITYSLMRKKWILQIKKGLYALVPLDIGLEGADSFIVHEFVIASYLIDPYYIGFWSALNYHGLTDQIPVTLFIATTKPRKPIRALNTEFRFVKLSERKFFGFEEIEIEGAKVKISDINKTICDCLDHPEHSGGIEEIAKVIYFSHEELDFNLIRNYALKMGNMTIMKRLGYILERTNLLGRYNEIFEGLKLSKGYSVLDTVSLKKGRYNSKWMLLVNREINPEGWSY